MNHMKNVLQSLLAGGLLIGLVPAQAQLNCGSGAAPGTDTQCNTDGLTETQMFGAITLFAPENGTTTFTSTVGQSVSNTQIRTLTGSGAGRIELNVGGHLGRGLDFSAHDGGLRLTVQAAGEQAGGLALATSTLGSGDDQLVVDSGGILTLRDNYPINQAVGEVSAIQIDFGGGTNLMVNRGVTVVGDARVPDTPQTFDNGSGPSYARAITLAQLGRFENEGELIMGGVITSPSFRLSSSVIDSRNLPATDTVARTALFMPGTDFVGGPGSVIRMDAVFRYGAAQVNCTDRVVRGPVTPSTPAGSPGATASLIGADCIDIAGGSTAGVTELVLYDEQPGALAANFGDNEILLINVEGGTSAAEHFVLSPQSEHYDARTGTLQQGFFQFPLIYDADNQQHRLVSLPGSRALALPYIPQALQAVARSVGRDAVNGEADAGVWVRLTQRQQQRDVQHRFDRYNVSVGVDSSHEIDTTVLTAGRSWKAGDWGIGGAISYVDAQLGFDGNDMQADFVGASIGLHADYHREGLFLDNLVQLQWLELDLTDPGFSPERRGSKKFGYVNLTPSTAYRNVNGNAGTQTLHVRSELGWRLSLGEQLYLEPLAGLSWVRAEIDEVTIQSYDRAADDNRFFGDHADSLRATVGGRAAFTRSGARLNLRATGSLRYWQSLKDKTTVTLANAGPDLVVQDDFDGGWTEVNAGLELVSPSGRVAGQLEAQALLGDYEGYGVTAGVRFQW
jgi:hypothetical protein